MVVVMVEMMEMISIVALIKGCAVVTWTRKGMNVDDT